MTCGSPAALVQVIVTEPPEVGFVGMSTLNPATKGARRARRLYHGY